jgi:hypothetical protein
MCISIVFNLLEAFMSRVFLTFLSALFVLGVIGAFPRPTLAAGAASCDVNACIEYCSKRGTNTGMGNYCSRTCLLTVDQNKKAGKCK